MSYALRIREFWTMKMNAMQFTITRVVCDFFPKAKSKLAVECCCRLNFFDLLNKEVICHVTFWEDTRHLKRAVILINLEALQPESIYKSLYKYLVLTVYTFFMNGDFCMETRLVCFLVSTYLFPTTKLTWYHFWHFFF